MINFLKNIFIWWNRQTIGTMLYTFFFGKFKGTDDSGNKYYESKSGKRWVIYKNTTEATSISNEWYSWIHFLSNSDPNKIKLSTKYFWQKHRIANATGTSSMYRPDKITKNKKILKKYDTWKN